MVLKLVVLFCLVVFPVRGADVVTHSVVARRALLHVLPWLRRSVSRDVALSVIGNDPDAFFACAPYPDFYYDGGDTNAAEVTHWSPFLVKGGEEIAKMKNGDGEVTERANALAACLAGIATHAASDVTFHGLRTVPVGYGLIESIGGLDRGCSGRLAGGMHCLPRVSRWGVGSGEDEGGGGEWGEKGEEAHFGGDTGGEFAAASATASFHGFGGGLVANPLRWRVPWWKPDGLLTVYGALEEPQDPSWMRGALGSSWYRLKAYLGQLIYPSIADTTLSPSYLDYPSLLSTWRDGYSGGIDDMSSWAANAILKPFDEIGGQEAQLADPTPTSAENTFFGEDWNGALGKEGWKVAYGEFGSAGNVVVAVPGRSWEGCPFGGGAWVGKEVGRDGRKKGVEAPPCMLGAWARAGTQMAVWDMDGDGVDEVVLVGVGGGMEGDGFGEDGVKQVWKYGGGVGIWDVGSGQVKSVLGVDSNALFLASGDTLLVPSKDSLIIGASWAYSDPKYSFPGIKLQPSTSALQPQAAEFAQRGALVLLTPSSFPATSTFAKLSEHISLTIIPGCDPSKIHINTNSPPSPSSSSTTCTPYLRFGAALAVARLPPAVAEGVDVDVLMVGAPGARDENGVGVGMVFGYELDSIWGGGNIVEAVVVIHGVEPRGQFGASMAFGQFATPSLPEAPPKPAIAIGAPTIASVYIVPCAMFTSAPGVHITHTLTAQDIVEDAVVLQHQDKASEFGSVLHTIPNQPTTLLVGAPRATSSILSISLHAAILLPILFILCIATCVPPQVYRGRKPSLSSITSQCSPSRLRVCYLSWTVNQPRRRIVTCLILFFLIFPPLLFLLLTSPPPPLHPNPPILLHNSPLPSSSSLPRRTGALFFYNPYTFHRHPSHSSPPPPPPPPPPHSPPPPPLYLNTFDASTSASSILLGASDASGVCPGFGFSIASNSKSLLISAPFASSPPPQSTPSSLRGSTTPTSPTVLLLAEAEALLEPGKARKGALEIARQAKQDHEWNGVVFEVESGMGKN